MSTRRKKIYRIIASYLLLNMVAEFCMPVAAFALTSGPEQPEFQSFTPASATEMVNLFTGDFSYNIPLMTVPGPNGGYPINLAYIAGIGMEQEASWVGLGWNINAGVINRSVRGLPDDFKGDDVVKKLHFRPSNTAVFGMGLSLGTQDLKKEFLGFDQLPYGAGVQVYYNNYRGIGFQFASNFALASSEQTSLGQAPPLRLNLTNSSDGIGVNVSYSAYDKVDEITKRQTMSPGGGLSWNSREGVTSIGLSISKSVSAFNGILVSNAGAGVNFVSNGYIPAASPEMDGFMADVELNLGTNINFTWKGKKISSMQASYNRSWVKNTTETYDGYGYLYNENSGAIYDARILEDLNREKDIPPGRQTKSIGVPIATYDAFNVSAQGIGGSFRPYRSDLGIYTIPRTTSTIYGGHVGTEFGSATVPTTRVKFGADLSYKQSQTYSGMWHNHFWVGNANQGWGPLADYVFQGLDGQGDYNGDHGYEPFYFKMAGELSSAPVSQLDFIGGASPVKVKLEETFEDGNNICPRPELESDLLWHGSSSTDLNPSDNHRASREKTVTRNSYRTHGQAERFTTNVPDNIYTTLNSFPAIGGTASPSAYDYSSKSDHHLAEFTETGADGSRYIYGIPVYVTGSKEVMFSKEGFNEYSTEYIVQYDANDASLTNNEPGTDEVYSSTELPQYSESFLLTQVVSPDYVDITGDGLSKDDLGYYTKFNYVLADDEYKWRAPYAGGILNTGFLSNTKDDKASYMYGTKEVYMLHSVETKTHVACFVLETTSREDAHAAIDDYSSSVTYSDVTGANVSWALDHISLYSKEDPDYGTLNATPLKSVYFDYDYSLCPNVRNNENTGNPSPDAGTGKLTLTGIYFTYRNNEKGKLSPYLFDYEDVSYETDLINPAYDPLGNDRWGTYKKQETSAYYRNNENPYTDQSVPDRYRSNQSAAAWCLKQITMPSGSLINIEYEADDYSYVQNKKAMQMCRVIGFGEDDLTNDNELSDVTGHLNKKNTRVYFELNEPISNSATPAAKNAIVRNYVVGIQDMYFKMFLELKKPYGEPLADVLCDYVEGFCKVKDEAGTYGFVTDGANDHLYGYVTVERVDRDDYPNVSGLIEVNPFEKAAWQYMYLERPDLFANPNIAIGGFANLLTTLSTIIPELATSVAPYITANVKGWGNNAGGDRPSYIRLNAPDSKKVGGGHRVSRITIKDIWDDISGNAGAEGSYGQVYTYKLVDGKSSGVAAYEPLVGGEENAMCLPIRYNSDQLVKKDGAFYVMEPLGESYFPAPVVGYSRVIVKSIVDDPNAYDGDDETDPEVTVSRTGQTEYEFYTAKDYPVFADRTELQKTWFPIPVTIPFVGSISYNMRGFSQGYSIDLNDMHGKLKAVSTYPSYADLTSVNTMPTRRVFYKYNGGYNASIANRLNSTVDVLTSDGIYAQATLGETYDFFFDLRQHSNETQDIGVQTNVTTNTVTPFDVLPTFMPSINVSKSLFRSAVAMKVIYRTGILMEVETMDDGAKSYARNLMFDSETGAPLLTEVQNEFEKPVYTYNYAAHWAYEGMQGAYKNQGMQFNGFTTSGGVLSVTNAENYFFPGDEIMYIPATGVGTMLWVTQISGNNVTLIDADGASAGNISGNFIIHRSGRRNLQSVSNGVIVSLSNPVTSRQFPLFDAFNAYTGAVEGMTASLSEFYTDCATGITRNVSLTWSSNTLLFSVSGGGVDCEAAVTFPEGHGIDNLAEALTWDLHYNGGAVTATKHSTTLQCTWSDSEGCFMSCVEDVLHASAVRFSENWSADVAGHEQKINFDDAGLTVTSTNEYKFGLRGVWRTHSNYLYQVDRKQTSASASGTDISKDGTYDNFALYSWNIAARDNTNWSFVSAVTRYSPYGYALETRDALGIYSSSMYGYDNTKQTAAASNCQYFEMGYDGFEEYGTTYTGGGHLLFTSLNVGSPIGIAGGFAHSGTKSLGVDYGGDGQYSVVCSGGTSPYATNQRYFEAIPGQEYFLSVWARGENGGTPAVIINNGVTTTTFNPDESVSAIEGWRKIDVRFVAPAASATLTINLSCEDSGTAYFDDLRIQPFKSAMASYVYDPQTHWLLAELDNRNFATFYNYDEEGALVQVKQETEKGIFTVQTSRGNIKR